MIERLEHDTALTLVTNDLSSEAKVIGEDYRRRWEIEAFFKKIKKNLKIKSFLGTSENAVKIQIYVAIITQILLYLYGQATRFKGNLTNMMVILRSGLLFSNYEDYNNKRRRLEKIKSEKTPQLQQLKLAFER